jgi:ankyrin repeat protein
MADGSGSAAASAKVRNLDMELMEAVMRGSSYDVGNLLEEGASPDGKFQNNPLHTAVLKSRVYETIVKQLLEKGADAKKGVKGVGGGYSTIPALAATRGTIPIMKLILEKHPELLSYVEDGAFDSHFTLVDLAAREKRADMVEFLLSQGMKPYPKEEEKELTMEEWKNQFYKTMMGTTKGGKRSSRRQKNKTKTKRRRSSVKNHTKRIR